MFVVFGFFKLDFPMKMNYCSAKYFDLNKIEKNYNNLKMKV